MREPIDLRECSEEQKKRRERATHPRGGRDLRQALKRRETSLERGVSTAAWGEHRGGGQGRAGKQKEPCQRAGRGGGRAGGKQEAQALAEGRDARRRSGL